MRIIPPEVAAQVEDMDKQKPTVVKVKPNLQRSATSMNVHEPGGTGAGAPSDITLQKRCTSLELQLDRWVGIAQLLASELAYREKRLWDWQLDNTNTKAILQKFKDRLKKSDGGKKPRSPLAMPSAGLAERKIGEDDAVVQEVGTPRQIPTSATGISMLIVEADESHSKALAKTCTDIGYRVTTASSGEEALDRIYAQHRGGSLEGVFELVLCDVELPGIPGVEVLNHLRSNLQHSDISIIMLASEMAGNMADMVERCIVEGADSYILKPAALKELTALWGFVARRRQHAVEHIGKSNDLNQLIRSVEVELGTDHGTAKGGDKSSAERRASGDAGKRNSGGSRELAAKASQAPANAGSKKRRVRWSMHEQFEEDLKADLAEAQKKDLPTEHKMSALINPKLEAGVSDAVSELLEIISPGTMALLPGEKGRRERGKSKGDSDKKGKKKAPAAGASSSSGKSPRVASDAPATLEDAEGGGGPSVLTGAGGSLQPPPPTRKLRKGDSGNLRKMLLERRKTSTGKSSQELLQMLHILEGDEELDDGQPDEMVMCRLCEQQVLRSSLQLHTAVCKATNKVRADDEAVNKEVRELLTLLATTRRNALLSLITIAVQRHVLLCGPLDKLVDLGGQLLRNDDYELSPLHHLGRLTELARELAQLKRAGGSELGGSVFYSCASQLKAIIAEKIGHVQELIDLDPHALDQSNARPLKRGTSFTGKLGIKDFTMIRLLASGGFAQVWLAKKKSTGDVMAVKAMRKEHLRNTDQVTSINVEHAILAKHSSDFLVRAFYSFRSSHHVYFALEYMPGGDLSSMLAECGCIAEPSAAFYVAETLMGMHYLHTKRILHRDIKPSNVLISESGHIKLADFGLSTSMMQHKKCGTLPYVAPEVLRDGSASEALDHWAVGVLLYELVAGEPPFRGDTPKQMLASILETPIDVRPLSPVAASLVRSLLNVDHHLRLGASGIEEIQGHAFFAFTQWDKLIQATPPFVPQLGGEDDDTYFPKSLLDPGSAHDLLDEEDSDDSDSESFKKIQGVNVDHLISLAKRPSMSRTASTNASQAPTPPQGGTPPSSSTPTASNTATPPSGSRPLRSRGDLGGAVSGSTRVLSSRGVLNKASSSLVPRPAVSRNFDA